jgi:diphosphomevalonate decarboxylase
MALVKYWGKRNERLRLPTNGSISLTLDGLSCETTVEIDPTLASDRLQLDGVERVGREVERVSAFLDLVRAAAGARERARVVSTSRVPLAAGLASSAAGFAALAAAAAAAYGLELSRRDLSILARRGSGSACRSIYGGFSEWKAGSTADGSDSYAEQILGPEGWDVGMVIAIARAAPKAVGSTEAMARSVESAAYRLWLSTIEGDLAEVRRGIEARDLAAVGRIAEANAVKMHMTAAAALPPIVFWTEATEAIVRAIPRWREDELECYFTVDAGPNVAVLAREKDLAFVEARLREIEGVERTLVCRPGEGATVTSVTR